MGRVKIKRNWINDSIYASNSIRKNKGVYVSFTPKDKKGQQYELIKYNGDRMVFDNKKSAKSFVYGIKNNEVVTNEFRTGKYYIRDNKTDATKLNTPTGTKIDTHNFFYYATHNEESNKKSDILKKKSNISNAEKRYINK